MEDDCRSTDVDTKRLPPRSGWLNLGRSGHRSHTFVTYASVRVVLRFIVSKSSLPQQVDHSRYRLGVPQWNLLNTPSPSSSASTAQVLLSAQCPVAIVRGENRTGGGPANGPVVVLVESGVCANSAVHNAFREAALRSAELLVVYLHQPRHWAVPASTTEVQSQVGIDPTVERWRAAYPGVRTREVAVIGYAGSYVEQLSRSSRLIVVARQKGSAASAHLGSTAHAMVYQAKCPVLVVP
jgi:nucleotide-binding universal stress UspA family protein